ncbi:SUKH-3 domain-containing protein [Saccharothrix sp. HUAS TT1]|uniref:SUKH-3 domain-containing protein n=1 Tax=unclassified Saccharothrix TaxID=2593673 RepID=UPI00345C58E0
MGRRWSEETERVLGEAGWRPGREVPTDGWESLLRERGGFEAHDAARRFLAEFGGLAVPARGPGVTSAKLSFTLDPSAAEWDDEIFDYLSQEAGAPLYPLGEVDRRNSYLGMAPDGSVYLGMDSVMHLAESGDLALERLVEGRT